MQAVTTESPPDPTEAYIDFLLSKIVVLTHERNDLVRWGNSVLVAIDSEARAFPRSGLLRITERIVKAHA